MKIFVVALITVLVLIALSSGAAVAKAQTNQVEAQPFPSITLNMSGGVFYNLSYMGLILKTPNGSYVTSFNQGKWNFTSGSNLTYSYASNVKFVPDNSQGIPATAGNPPGGNGNGHNSTNGGNGNGHNSTSGGSSNGQQNNTQGSHGGGPPTGIAHGTIDATVAINLKALNDSLSNMGVVNSSANSNKYSFPQYSMLEITISVTFQNTVNGPGDLQLIQLIKSSNETNGVNGYYFGDIVHDNSMNVHGNSQGVQIHGGTNTSDNATANAFYWWNNNFDLNGVQQNLTSSVVAADGGVFITFNFAFNNSTQLKSVYQDPYLGVPGLGIFNSPIVHKIVKTVVNYVIVNAISLSAGIASGVVLVGGATYSVYRKRRF